MKYNEDIRGEFSGIFQKLREVILSFKGIQEIKNNKQTTYCDSNGRAVCMMRSRGDKFVLAFAQGAKLVDKYPFLEGCGKVVKHVNFSNMNEIDEKLLQEMFEESLVLNMEDVELKKLRRAL